MDEELPYKILKIMRDIYNKDPTGYMGMDYFEPALNLSEEVIQGALIYLKEKGWVKSNAKWWSDGAIPSEEFVRGLQYLVKMGIIRV
ncbi:MAG: hypothetical protein ACW9W4_05710 [Candidatus Nitrosopumilus sp. bin_7KS]